LNNIFRGSKSHLQNNLGQFSSLHLLHENYTNTLKRQINERQDHSQSHGS
jgi:hypothetical protein